jgi:hypothetical protein
MTIDLFRFLASHDDIIEVEQIVAPREEWAAAAEWEASPESQQRGWSVVRSDEWIRANRLTIPQALLIPGPLRRSRP